MFKFPSLDDILGPVTGMFNKLPSLDQMLSGTVNSIGSSLDKVIGGISGAISTVINDPVSVVRKVNEVTNAATQGLGKAIQNTLGREGLFNTVGVLVDNTVGKVGTALNSTIDKVGSNPLVGVAAASGGIGVAGIGIGIAIIAALLFKKV